MIDFLKKKKIILIIITLGVGVYIWNIFSTKNNIDISAQNELMVSENNSKEENKNKAKEMIIVHIAGEVKRPGIIEIKEGSRIKDVIEQAGGLTEQADITNVNLAYIVEDGIKIKIPSIDDEDLAKEEYITKENGPNIIVSENNTSSSNRKCSKH